MNNFNVEQLNKELIDNADSKLLFKSVFDEAQVLAIESDKKFEIKLIKLVSDKLTTGSQTSASVLTLKTSCIREDNGNYVTITKTFNSALQTTPYSVTMKNIFYCTDFSTGRVIVPYYTISCTKAPNVTSNTFNTSNNLYGVLNKIEFSCPTGLTFPTGTTVEIYGRFLED